MSSQFHKRCPGCVTVIPTRTTMCECCAGKARARAVAMAGSKVVAKPEPADAVIPVPFTGRLWCLIGTGSSVIAARATRHTVLFAKPEVDANYLVTLSFGGLAGDGAVASVTQRSANGFVAVVANALPGSFLVWNAYRMEAPAKPAPKVGDSLTDDTAELRRAIAEQWRGIYKISTVRGADGETSRSVSFAPPAKAEPKVGDRVRVRIDGWGGDIVGELQASDNYDFSLRSAETWYTPGIYTHEILEVLP